MRPKNILFVFIALLCICAMTSCESIDVNISIAGNEASSYSQEKETTPRPEANLDIKEEGETAVDSSQPTIGATESYTSLGSAISLDAQGNINQEFSNGYIYDVKEGYLHFSLDGGTSWIKSEIMLFSTEEKSTPNESTVGIYVSDSIIAAVYEDVSQAGTLLLHISKDRGQTWEQIFIPVTTETGEVTWIKVGFTSPTSGWLIACSYQMAGVESHVLMRTEDGGMNWSVIDNNLDEVYKHKITGANFIDESLGFVTYRFDDGLYVARTEDGGTFWEMCNFFDISKAKTISPMSPVWIEGTPKLPIQVYDEESSTILTLSTQDNGRTWIQ